MEPRFLISRFNHITREYAPLQCPSWSHGRIKQKTAPEGAVFDC